MVNIERNLYEQKPDLLEYFRNRSREIVKTLEDQHGQPQFKKITAEFQPRIKRSRDAIASALLQSAEREHWSPVERLQNILLVHYCANVIMLETRNAIWPYEYMAFSRRIGEIWEPFCSLCFQYALNEDLTLEVPPVFADVRDQLQHEMVAYIDSLPLSPSQKRELAEYYRKVWLLVDAGEIKLELDLHFRIASDHYNVDFKSGFGSNEKGNTNRLLVVASVYQNIIAKDYRNLILVRSAEQENNHYLQILKNSSVWEVNCRDEAYEKIGELSGFNLAKWIQENIDWSADLSPTTVDYLGRNDLVKYLKW